LAERGVLLRPVDKPRRWRQKCRGLLTTRCQVPVFPLRSPLDIW